MRADEKSGMRWSKLLPTPPQSSPPLYLIIFTQTPSAMHTLAYANGHIDTHETHTQTVSSSKAPRGSMANVTTALMSSPEWVTLLPGERSGVTMEMQR